MSFFIFVVTIGLEVNFLITAWITLNPRWLVAFCAIHAAKSFMQIMWNGQVEVRIDRLFRMFAYGSGPQASEGIEAENEGNDQRNS